MAGAAHGNLVFSRMPGESIVIDGKIVVTIVRHTPSGVRIAVRAPREISVHRSEIQKRIDAETDAASAETPSI